MTFNLVNFSCCIVIYLWWGNWLLVLKSGMAIILKKRWIKLKIFIMLHGECLFWLNFVKRSLLIHLSRVLLNENTVVLPLIKNTALFFMKKVWIFFVWITYHNFVHQSCLQDNYLCCCISHTLHSNSIDCRTSTFQVCIHLNK